MSQWLEHLPDIRLAWVREPLTAEKHLHQSPSIHRRETARDADILCLGTLNLQACSISVKTLTIVTATGVDYPVYLIGQFDPMP